jgi:hypothetical protein
MNYTVLTPQPLVSFMGLRNEGTKLINLWFGGDTMCEKSYKRELRNIMIS